MFARPVYIMLHTNSHRSGGELNGTDPSIHPSDHPHPAFIHMFSLHIVLFARNYYAEFSAVVALFGRRWLDFSRHCSLEMNPKLINSAIIHTNLHNWTLWFPSETTRSTGKSQTSRRPPWDHGQLLLLWRWLIEWGRTFFVNIVIFGGILKRKNLNKANK